MPDVFVMIPPAGRGEFIVQGKNFVGSACELATAPLIKKIGGAVSSNTPTIEEHQEVCETGQ